MKRFFLLLVAIAICCSAKAKVTLPRVLGSNMVLQQSAEVELWGKAEAGRKVTVEVSWSKSKLKTQADANGDWSVKVQTPKGSLDKHSITISDGEKLCLENVMVAANVGNDEDLVKEHHGHTLGNEVEANQDGGALLRLAPMRLIGDIGRQIYDVPLFAGDDPAVI